MSAKSTTASRVPGTKLPCYVFTSDKGLSRYVAGIVSSVIRERQGLGQQAVLGLPSGSTPVGVYRELARMHREEGLDFSNVVTFNLGEYYGVAADRQQSYHLWMHENFFKNVNIPPENIHIPDGMVPEDQVEQYCREYDTEIEMAGGIDILLLGIGLNGHIGFNEPLSHWDSPTRLVRLDPETRRVAAGDFYSIDSVPTHAITMGIGTIQGAKKTLLMALGEAKAPIIGEAAEGPVTERVPASILQEHIDASVLVDTAVAEGLSGFMTPWLLQDVEWDPPMIKRAVLWLCEEADKALLKLDDEDFRRHNLHQLLRNFGPAPKLAHKVFRWMMETIEYHPAGHGAPCRVLCFSPHPDDDCISMGGTLIRMGEDEHEVHTAYMTSGNIAVFDHDARRIAQLAAEFNRRFDIEHDRTNQLCHEATESINNKAPGELDTEAVLRIKALIRWSEARAAAQYIGCHCDNIHFLDLPFYRTGTIAKNPIGEEDINIVLELIERISPEVVFVAGDLSDPHGTHRMCAEAIFSALGRLPKRGREIPEVLLYRGAWQEYDLHELEIAVPLSPSDIERKRKAIFMHESQKDAMLFPGADTREFWQRAEERNKGTAKKYNDIGLPEYFAMEAFVRWNNEPL